MSQLPLNEDAVCENCGRFGAYELDGIRLCADCYEARGSCCREFGGNDFWKEPAESKPQPEDRKSDRS